MTDFLRIKKLESIANSVLWWAFTGLLGLVTAGMAWWVKNIWSMVSSQQQQISALNLELARNYVPRAELQSSFERIFNKLDEILSDQNRGR